MFGYIKYMHTFTNIKKNCLFCILCIPTQTCPYIVNTIYYWCEVEFAFWYKHNNTGHNSSEIEVANVMCNMIIIYIIFKKTSTRTKPKTYHINYWNAHMHVCVRVFMWCCSCTSQREWHGFNTECTLPTLSISWSARYSSSLYIIPHFPSL